MHAKRQCTMTEKFGHKRNNSDPCDRTPNLDKLRSHHAALDRWNLINDPSPEDQPWVMTEILKHTDRFKTDTSGRTSKSIKFKVKFTDGDMAWHTIDTMRLEDPHLVIGHAIEKGIDTKEGFE